MRRGGRCERRELLVVTGAGTLLAWIEGDAAAVPPPPPGHPMPPPPELRIDGRVSRNHGHALGLTLSDIDAAADRTFDLSGTSGHKHEVTFTRADFLALQQAKIVRLASTPYGGHLHRIYARVVQYPPPPLEINACKVFIGGRDDHELIVPQRDLEGGVDRTYDIQANSPHTHALTIRAGDFARLRGGEKLTLKTGAGAEDHHTHVVFVSYERPPAPPAR